MTVSAGVRSSTAGNGTTTSFVATFRASATTGVGVATINDTTKVVTFPVLDTDYTATLSASGIPTVVFTTAPASGNTVIIYPVAALTQPDTFTPGGPLYGSSIEDAFDKVLTLIQSLDDQIKQCIRVPQGDTAIAELPAASGRFNTALTFNATGVPTLT